MILQTSGLELLKERFLAHIPDFGDFRDRPSTYWEQERAYKDELARFCRDVLTPDLFATEPQLTGAEQVVRMTNRVLTKRLETVSMSQNLLSWRYFDFLKRLDDEERIQFARSFGDLLFGPGNAPERVGRFTAVMWPIWTRIEGGNPYALSRNFPTLFMMLLEPDQNIVVRSDMLAAAAKPLLGDWLLRYAPFVAEDYERVLDFASSVRSQLEAWAWRPRDMIDVHSFLWVATSESYGGGEGEPSAKPESQDRPELASADLEREAL